MYGRVYKIVGNNVRVAATACANYCNLGLVKEEEKDMR